MRKREDSIIVKNYRPVSILQNSIKYPQTVDVKQIIECINHFFWLLSSVITEKDLALELL